MSKTLKFILVVFGASFAYAFFNAAFASDCRVQTIVINGKLVTVTVCCDPKTNNCIVV